MKRVIFTLLMSLNLSAAFGAQFGSAYGEIGELAAGAVGTGAPPKNLMYFNIVGTSTFADCATSSAPKYVIDQDDFGDTMVALLLSSKVSGTKIHVAGRGTCSKMAGHEDVSLIYID